MADDVRIGIVGLGMGRDRANKAANTPGAKLVAVCDILEERGAKAAEELEVEWITDYEEMRRRELGDEALRPTRIKYKPLAR